MSRLDAFMQQSGAATLLEQLGRSVVYHTRDADPATIIANVAGAGADVVADETGRDETRTRLVTFSKDPTASHGGVASPLLSDEIEIDGERWAIEEFVPELSTQALCTVRVVRKSAVERARSGYRRGS